LCRYSAASASSTAAADAATAYGKAAMHLALSGGGNAGAVTAIGELLQWAGGSNPAATPAPITAAVLALCTEAAELGLLEDAGVVAGGAARFGAGAVGSLARGRAEDAAIVVGANRAAARLAANLTAPCASGGIPAGARAAGKLAASLLSRGAESAAAAAALAPALPALLSGMLRQHADTAVVLGEDWLAPVAAGAASLFRNPDAADEDGDGDDEAAAAAAAHDEEEDEEAVALPKAVLAAARLPAQQVALAGALARYTAFHIGFVDDVEDCGDESAWARPVSAEAARDVKGATAMLQRLAGAGALPAPAAAALRAARDAAVALPSAGAWAAAGVTPSLSALVAVMA
jgi:hypothetical protein